MSLPFTPKISSTIATNPLWTALACAYLEHAQLVLQIQLFKLDLAENRSMVEELLDEIRVNLHMIRDIADQAKKLGRVSLATLTANDGNLPSSQVLVNRVAQLAGDILTKVRESNSIPVADKATELFHRIVVVTLVLEALADLDSKDGFFGSQLSVKRKRVETDDSDDAAIDCSTSAGTNQSTKKFRTAQYNTGSALIDLDSVQDTEETMLPLPKAQRRSRGPKCTKPHPAGREISPLFVQQEDDEVQKLEAAGSKSLIDAFDAIPVSIFDAKAEDRSLPESVSSGESITVFGRYEGNAQGTSHVQDTDQNRPVVPPKSVQPRSRKLRSASMNSVFLAGAKKDYAELNNDFRYVYKTYNQLKRRHKGVKKRNADLKNRMSHMCPGSCDEELEEAHHRNWKKSNHIRALQAIVAERDSKIGELGNTVKEKSDEISRLEAMVQELKLSQSSN